MTAGFTCPRCGKTSHNPNDVLHGYCGNCHQWTGEDPEPLPASIGRPCGCAPQHRIICTWHCQWQGCTETSHTDACIAGDRIDEP